MINTVVVTHKVGTNVSIIGVFSSDDAANVAIINQVLSMEDRYFEDYTRTPLSVDDVDVGILI